MVPLRITSQTADLDCESRHPIRVGTGDLRTAVQMETTRGELNMDDFSDIPDPDDLNDDRYPGLYNISPAFFYEVVPVPLGGRFRPEYVYVDPKATGLTDLAMDAAISMWNIPWEAGHFRRTMMDKRFPRVLRKVIDAAGDECDVRLVPLDRKCGRYSAYAPLYHLLPLSLLKRHGLPPLKKGSWPAMISHPIPYVQLPRDFEARLASAFAELVWPLLSPGSPAKAFSAKEPIRLLAHNLDFWLPHIDRVAQQLVETLGRCDVENDDQRKKLERGRQIEFPPEYGKCTIERPLHGGYIWEGTDEAMDATERMVEDADHAGKLRGILDAVRSNRIEDDFSPYWSYAREDFERKLYRKRGKSRVTFVELDETIPVHGPDSQVDEHLFWEDFVALLDMRERRIIVCLRSGYTQGEIAKALNYATHSPVSKALARILKKAQRLLDS
jgi:hypothetical protein